MTDWITVNSIDGHKNTTYPVPIPELSVGFLKEKLNEMDPDTDNDINLLNGLVMMDNETIFDQDTKYVLTLVKIKSFSWYQKQTSRIFCNKTFYVNDIEFSCWHVYYYDGELKILFFADVEFEDDYGFNLSQDFYYKKGDRGMRFDPYYNDNDNEGFNDTFTEFAESFDLDTKDFLDDLLEKCKYEAEKIGHESGIDIL